MSPSASRITRKPVRTRVWASAISTRIFADTPAILPVRRPPPGHPCGRRHLPSILLAPDVDYRRRSLASWHTRSERNKKMNGILKGVRPLDYALAGLMTAAGAYLMYENLTAGYGELPHAQSSRSWLMLPAFVLVTLPVLWRRRNILA